MARAEPGTAKFQSKQLKASGLQRLRFYCQICQKQCRDANGFKNHLSSPSHNGRIANLSENGSGAAVVNEFSRRFERDFLNLLRINHGTKKIDANKFYQEYILNDKDHVHMNATKWTSLTSFIKHLGSTGKVRVDVPETPEEEFSLIIRLVDSKVVDSKDKAKEVQTEEERSQKFLEWQIQRGKELEKNNSQDFDKKDEIKPRATNVSLSLKGLKSRKANKRAFGDSDDEQ